MEAIFHVVKTWYMSYQIEVILGVLACILVLMIVTLLAVRKCRKQIKQLTNHTREMTKIALRQSQPRETKREGLAGNESVSQQPKRPLVSPEKEELFGSVIQEIFP